MAHLGISGAVFDSGSFDTNSFSINSWDFGGVTPSPTFGVYKGLYLGLYFNVYKIGKIQ